MELVVKTEELEKLFQRCILKLKQDQIEEISIDMDYYKIILADEWAPENENTEIAIGSLCDDWENIQKVIQNKQIFTYVDFDRTSSILRAISEILMPSN